QAVDPVPGAPHVEAAAAAVVAPANEGKRSAPGRQADDVAPARVDARKPSLLARRERVLVGLAGTAAALVDGNDRAAVRAGVGGDLDQRGGDRTRRDGARDARHEAEPARWILLRPGDDAAVGAYVRGRWIGAHDRVGPGAGGEREREGEGNGQLPHLPTE